MPSYSEAEVLSVQGTVDNHGPSYDEQDSRAAVVVRSITQVRAGVKTIKETR